MVSVTQPVFDARDRFIGVAGVDLALDLLAERVQKICHESFQAVGAGGRPSDAYLVSKEGKVFARKCDLRLMSWVKDVHDIPTRGKDLIIVAAVDNVLHFRMFNGAGKVVVDTDEKRLTEKAWQIENLRKQLVSLWPPHELTGSEKDQVINNVTLIVGRTPNEALRELPEGQQVANSPKSPTDRMQLDATGSFVLWNTTPKSHWKVVLSVPEATVYAPAWSMMMRSLRFNVICLGLMVGIVSLVARRVMGPIPRWPPPPRPSRPAITGARTWPPSPDARTSSVNSRGGSGA